jgi:hypothetical protein
MIGEGGGSAEALRAEAIGGDPDLIATFHAVRGREYREGITGCGEIIAQIEVLTATSHCRYNFGFAVAEAYAGHEDNGRGSRSMGAMAT